MVTEEKFPLALSAKRIPQCKICRIADTDPDFLPYLYKLRFDSNLPLDKIAELANDVLRQNKEKSGRWLPSLNPMNLSRHFSKHVPASSAQTYRKQVMLRTTQAQSAVNNAPQASKERIEEAVRRGDAELNPFRNLVNMYERLDKKLTALPEDDPITMEELNLVKEMARMLYKLHRMRQSDKIVGQVVSELMSVYTDKIIIAALSQLDASKAQLATHIEDAKVRDELIVDLRKRLGRAFMQAAEDAVKEVNEKYHFEA